MSASTPQEIEKIHTEKDKKEGTPEYGGKQTIDESPDTSEKSKTTDDGIYGIIPLDLDISLQHSIGYDGQVYISNVGVIMGWV